jgi:rhodanese-related sulfurtransferase
MKRILTVLLFILFNSSANLHAAAIATTDTILADTLSRWITKGTTFDFILIDVRDSSTELSLTGVIATAQCRPYNFSYNRGVFDRLIPQLPKQAHIVLYCRTGVRSGICATKLDSAGFSYVYSLKAGFNGWNGPKDSISRVLPASNLPSPSRLAAATKSIVPQNTTPDRFFLFARKNTIFANATVQAQHVVQIYNLAGKCILQSINPFSRQSDLSMPGSIAPGTYVARLSSKKLPVLSFTITISN